MIQNQIFWFNLFFKYFCNILLFNLVCT